jgi:hypothetical protein
VNDIAPDEQKGRPRGGNIAYGAELQREAVERQDRKFCRAMLAAIKRGDESAPTSISTVPCTKRPLFVDLRAPESRGGGEANARRTVAASEGSSMEAD